MLCSDVLIIRIILILDATVEHIKKFFKKLAVPIWFCKYMSAEVLRKIKVKNPQTIQLKISTLTTRDYTKAINNPMQHGTKLFPIQKLGAQAQKLKKNPIFNPYEINLVPKKQIIRKCSIQSNPTKI